METDINTIKIPDVNLPYMQLYYAIHEIALLYRKNKWNREIKSELYSIMYLVKNRMLEDKES